MTTALTGSYSDKTTKQKTQTDPWDETIPYLKDLLGKIGSSSGGIPGVTQQQSDAFSQLETNANNGNPHVGDINKLADDMFGATSKSPYATDAYAALKTRLDPVADGTNQDVLNDPSFQKMLQFAGDDAATRINSQFAGAGRDLSGINQQSVSRGVTQAQLPVIVNQANMEKARTDAAARTLYDDSVKTGTTANDLDNSALATRAGGIPVAQAAMDAQNQGPNQILSLEEQQKQLPFDELSWLAQLLYPAAGLGQQSKGTANTSGWTIGAGGKGDLGTGLGSLFIPPLT